MSLAIRVTDRQSNKISRACVEPLLILMIETYWRIMNLKFRTVRSVFFGLSALLFGTSSSALRATNSRERASTAGD